MNGVRYYLSEKLKSFAIAAAIVAAMMGMGLL
jgi:hypothetical protein